MSFIARLMVVLLLVGVGAQSPADSYPPEECLEVTFAGCYGIEAESYANGVFGIYDGECPGASGAAAYYNIVTEMYMHKTTGAWMINAACIAMRAQRGAH